MWPIRPKLEQGLQQRHAGAGLRPQLFLAEPARLVLQFGGELVGDDPRGHRDAGRQVLRAFAAVDGVKVVLDDLQRQVLVPLERQDKAEPLDVAVRVLPVAGGCALRD